MKILIAGAKGQLGRCLIDQGLSKGIEIDACDSTELDITNRDVIKNKLERSSPDFVINAAAYTAVDKAESEPEKAYAVNELGSLNLAIACSEQDIPLIHVSTDYVFSGIASTAYKEEDSVDPQGVYGASKLAGEHAVINNCEKHIIVRTAWVFSEYGNNFVKTMLRLAQSRDQLSVVHDQIGNPTYAGDIAGTLLAICKSGKESWGVYHYVGATETSWYEFASVIFERAFSSGLIDNQIEVKPIATSEYPTAAARPAYSVLDTRKIQNTFGVKAVSMNDSLGRVLNKLVFS